MQATSHEQTVTKFIEEFSAEVCVEQFKTYKEYLGFRQEIESIFDKEKIADILTEVYKLAC